MTVTPVGAQWRLTVGAVAPEANLWSYSAWPGMYSDLDSEADLPAVVMAVGATVEWAYTDQQLPSQLDPTTLTFTLYARTAADLPTNLQRGTWVKWAVDLYPFGGTPLALHSVSGARVTEATLDLHPESPWKARLTVKAADLLADLVGLTPVLYAGEAIRRRARERLVQICNAIARDIGLPSATPQGANPGLIAGGSHRLNQQWSGSARDQLAAWCNSADDTIMAGIVTPWYNPAISFPAGYSWAGPSVWYQPALPQSNTAVKYLIASSAKPAPNKLPLRLANVGGLLTLTYAPAADQHTAALDGGVVEVPGRLRSGREHAPNVFRWSGTVEGQDTTVTPNVWVDKSVSFDYSTSDAAATGPRVREVPTLLELGFQDPNNQEVGPLLVANLATLSAAYLPDAYALSTSWAWDAIDVHAYAMAEAQVRSVLPMLIPSYPGEAGDGVLIRHATLYNMDPDLTAAMPQGYVTGGRMVFESGRLGLELTMVPGSAPGTGTRITVGEVDAATWHAIPAGSIDPSIRVSDLALVDA